MSVRSPQTVTANDIDPRHGHCCMDCGRNLEVGDTQYERLVDFTDEAFPIVEFICGECDAKA